MAIRREPNTKIKATSYAVLQYIKEHDGEDFTADDIANELAMTTKKVNGIITMCFQNTGLTMREEHEIELGDGTHKKVKFIRLTDAGRAYAPEEIIED